MKVAFKFHEIWRLLTMNIVLERIFYSWNRYIIIIGLTFDACMPWVSMKLLTGSFNIGISINISFCTPVLALWTYLHKGILHKCKKDCIKVQLFLVRIDWFKSFKSVIKSKKSSTKIICSFESCCDLYGTFNWYSNRFHLLLKKAETSYDNTSHN